MSSELTEQAGRQLTQKKTGDIQIGGVTLSPIGAKFTKSVKAEDWRQVGEFIKRAESGVQWWIGDWLNYGEGRPGWGDKYAKEVDEFGRDVDTLKQYKSVSSVYDLCDRSHNLSWTHHLVVAYEAYELCERSHNLSWSHHMVTARARARGETQLPKRQPPDAAYRARST